MARRSMTVQERLADISKRTGLSEEIIRRVFSGETASILDSLKRGEPATLIGRCSITPELRNKLSIGGEVRGKIKGNVKLSGALESELAKITSFEKAADDDEEMPTASGVRVMQLSALQ